MFHVSEEQIPGLKSLFSDFASSLEKKLSLDFCGIDSFKEKVIFLSVNKNDKSSSAGKGSSFEILKALNARLHHSFLPHFEAGGNRNYIPENFFPHIALALKLTKTQFEKGIQWAKASLPPSDERKNRFPGTCPVLIVRMTLRFRLFLAQKSRTFFLPAVILTKNSCVFP